MSTATLTNAPSIDHTSRTWILRAVVILLVALALAAGAFALGRASKSTARVPATTVHTASPAKPAVSGGSCTIAHGMC